MSFKLKSRWLNRTQEAEAEAVSTSEQPQKHTEKPGSASVCVSNSSQDAVEISQAELQRPPKFSEILENIFVNEKPVFKGSKESKRMLCDCTTSPEERIDGKAACGEECLNRILFIECGPKCICGEHCTNNRFQKRAYAKLEPCPAGQKGWGLRSLEDLAQGQFVIEYVGEVLNASTFRHRMKRYARDPTHKHHYFMALRNDEVIDATDKGNVSRFINHSCMPNCETQKWTVNGQLRVGFFTKRPVSAGEEITFDYQFERYGREAQKCYCGSENCRGFIGGQPSEEEKEAVKEQIARERRRKAQLEDMAMEKQLNELVEAGELRTREQVLDFCRLMVRGDDFESRMKLLDVLMKTEEPLLRLFLDYHGCWLIWSWMVDDENIDRVSWRKLQKNLLIIMKKLPIPHRNMLEDSRVLRVVKRWAEPPARKSESAVIREEVSSVVRSLVDCVVSDVESGDRSPASSSSSHIDDSTVEECASPSEEDVLLAEIRELSQQLISGPWVELKEYFKIPKKTEAGKAARAGRSQREPVTEADTSSSQSSKLTPVFRQSQMTKYNESFRKTAGSQMPRPSRSRSGSRSPPSRRRATRDPRRSPLLSLARDSKRSPLLSLARDPRRSPLLSLARDPRRSPLLSLDRNRSYASKRHSPGYSSNSYRKARSRSRSPAARNPLASRADKRKRTSRFDRKTPPHLMKLRAEGKPLSVEDRRREFELSVASENEEEQKKMMSMEFDLAAAAVNDDDMQLEDSLVQSEEAMVLSPCNSQETLDSTVSDVQNQINTGISKAEGAAMPALLVGDPNTCRYWWQDQASGTLVYPLTDEQLAAVTGNDWSVTPHFVYNADSGLIHEVKLEKSVPDAQDPVVSSSESATVQVASLPASPATLEPSLPDPTSTTDLTAQQQILALQEKIKELEAKIDKQDHQKRRKRVSSESSESSEETPPEVKTREETPEEKTREETPEEKTRVKGPKLEDKPELPEDWKTAFDSEGNIYYYNVKTRDVQWERPEPEPESNPAVLPVPPPAPEVKIKKPKAKTKLNDVDSPAKRFHPETTTAAADTSSEVGKKQREKFKAEISNFVIKCLHPYQKPDSKVGKISSSDDFKHLARKLSHAVMEKEMKHTSRTEDLRVTESVRVKAKDYIKKYMKKLGPTYRRSISASGHRSASPNILFDDME